MLMGTRPFAHLHYQQAADPAKRALAYRAASTIHGVVVAPPAELEEEDEDSDDLLTDDDADLEVGRCKAAGWLWLKALKAPRFNA